MPTPKINDDQLLNRLAEVFQSHGYEGASLSLFSRATGLQRASLYHRFPGGKEEMAQAVLTRIDETFGQHVLAPLAERGGSGDLHGHVRLAADRLKEFYFGGDRSCLLETLSLGDPDSALHRHIERSMSAWIEAFSSIARQAGHAARAAQRRAEDALIRIQGALVLARITGDRKPFARVLKDLPRLLLDPIPT